MNDSEFPPVRLATVPGAFDHSGFIFELKYDGYRAVAHTEHSGNLRLISRNGNASTALRRARAELRRGSMERSSASVWTAGRDSTICFAGAVRRVSARSIYCGSTAAIFVIGP